MGRIADFFSLLFICIPCKAKKNKVVPFAANTVDEDSLPNAAISIQANYDNVGNRSSSLSLHRAAAAGNECFFLCRKEQALTIPLQNLMYMLGTLTMLFIICMLNPSKY